MGRNKISIKVLEPASQRTSTFSKRSKGIKKKAKELSIISDAQVLLLLRTTTGKYDLFHDENSSFDGLVQKFLNETQKNLEDSRSDGVDFLRKKFKSESHTLNAISLMDHGTCPTDDNQQGSDQEMHLKNIKLEVSNLESQLGSLRNIDEIEKLEKYDELVKMEHSIMELLSMNDQQLTMESISTAKYNSGDKRYFTISAPGPNSGVASQSRVLPSLARNNPPMPLLSTNYAESVVNTGFDQRFHDMLQPANLPTNLMNTPAPPSPIFRGPHPSNDWSHTMREWENNCAQGAANPGQVIQEPPLSVYAGDPGASTQRQLPMNPLDCEAKLLAEAMDQYHTVEGRAAQQYYPAMANDYEAGSSHL